MAMNLQDYRLYFDREVSIAQGFTQLKPEFGGRIVLSFIGKVKASAYHWLPERKKGYRCNGNTCPACKAGIAQSWSAVALAIEYTAKDSGQIGYVPLSRTTYREVSKLNGAKRTDGTHGVYDCNVTITRDDDTFSFTSDNGPARWKQSAALREQVENAKASVKIERLLVSKLYEKLTDSQWRLLLT